MALTKTVQYYLARFALTLSHRGFVDGATYTDVQGAAAGAQPADAHLGRGRGRCSSSNIFRQGWVFPIIAVGLWGFISIVVGTIYPAVIQRFVVQPNEFAREADRTSSATSTRRAPRSGSTTDRDARRSTTPNRPRSRPTSSTSKTTLDNVRLWDPPRAQGGVPGRRRSSSPSIKFSDVDVDRYDVNGDDDVPTLIARARARLRRHPRATTWTNRHLVYTHGYGAVAAAANRQRPGPADATCSPTSRRRPSCPLDPTSPASTSARAFGGYVGRRHQGRRARGDGERRTRKTTQYSGDGGVKVSSFLRKSRARTALRRLEPRRVRARSRASRGSSTSATSSERVRDGRAVPAVRRRSVPGRRRTAGSCGCSTATRRRTAIRTRSRSTRTCRPAAGSTPTSTTCATR